MMADQPNGADGQPESRFKTFTELARSLLVFEDPEIDHAQRVIIRKHQAGAFIENASDSVAFKALMNYAADNARKALTELANTSPTNVEKIAELQVVVRAARMIGQFVKQELKIVASEAPKEAPAKRRRNGAQHDL